MKKFAMSTVAALVLFCGSTKAQNPFQPPFGVAPPVVKTEGAPLTDNDVEEMLKKLGYQPKKVVDGGMAYYVIGITKDGRTYNMGATLSPSRKFLYLVAFVGDPVSDAGQLSAAGLLKLLEMNDRIAPAFFAYSPANKMVKLQMPIHNSGITSEFLGGMIQSFVGHIQAGIEASKNLTVAPVVPPAPTFPGFKPQ